MLGEKFAGNLYGPGQPLDANKYFLIPVDAIGAGNRSKPSDGMRATCPAQTLLDMVNAQKMLLTEYPEFRDGGVPIASLPGPMAGRNWMMRRMVRAGYHQR